MRINNSAGKKWYKKVIFLGERAQGSQYAKTLTTANISAGDSFLITFTTPSTKNKHPVHQMKGLPTA